MKIPSKLRTHCISTLRRAWLRNPVRSAVLQAARIGRGIYVCNICSGITRYKDIKIDHIEPVVDPAVGWVSFDEFILRLFCDAENLQAICEKCHLDKTRLEREIRKNTRKSLTKKAKKRIIRKLRKRK